MNDRPEWFPLGELKIRLEKAGTRKTHSLVQEYERREIPAGQVRIMHSAKGFELWINGAEYRIPFVALFDQALAQVQANQEAMAGVTA